LLSGPETDLLQLFVTPKGYCLTSDGHRFIKLNNMVLPSLLLLVPTVLSASVDIWHGHQGDGQAKAAYFLDNNPRGSAVICLSIGFDGIVNDPVRTSTGGYGAIGTNLTGFPNAADSLISQGSVTVNGNVGSLKHQLQRKNLAYWRSYYSPSTPAAILWPYFISTRRTHASSRWLAPLRTRWENFPYLSPILSSSKLVTLSIHALT